MLVDFDAVASRLKKHHNHSLLMLDETIEATRRELKGVEIISANNLYGVHPTDPEWETALKIAQAVATQGPRLWINIPEPSKALATNLARDGLKVNKVVPNAQALQELANTHYPG